MQSVVDDALREIIREAESKSDALNKKMGELEILFKQSEKNGAEKSDGTKRERNERKNSKRDGTSSIVGGREDQN